MVANNLIIFDLLGPTSFSRNTNRVQTLKYRCEIGPIYFSTYAPLNVIFPSFILDSHVNDLFTMDLPPRMRR